MDLLTQFYVTVALMLFSGAVGYYAGERGMAGVKVDLNNTKNEIEKVKALVTPQTTPQAVTVTATDTSHEITPTTTTAVTPGI